MTLYADNYSELAELTIPYMEKYCKRHGYSFHPVKCEVLKDNSFGFRKVKEAAKLLPKYDALMVMDIDCLITNQTKKIEDYLERGKDFYISRDINGFNA